MSHIDQMPQLHTGSFLTKEQAEQFKEAFKNLTVVVRCKDCIYAKRHWSDSVFGKPLYSCSHVSQIGRETQAHPADWFCADGQKKEGR